MIVCMRKVERTFKFSYFFFRLPDGMSIVSLNLFFTFILVIILRVLFLTGKFYQTIALINPTHKLNDICVKMRLTHLFP